MIIGAQLYNLREYCKTLEDLEKTLYRVAEMGYTIVQLSGVCDYTAEEMILEFLSAKETITRADVEQMAGISSASAARILRKMVLSGVLSKTGDGRNTKYRLANV